MHVSQVITLQSPDLYSAVCQLYLNETGRREKRNSLRHHRVLDYVSTMNPQLRPSVFSSAFLDVHSGPPSFNSFLLRSLISPSFTYTFLLYHIKIIF